MLTLTVFIAGIVMYKQLEYDYKIVDIYNITSSLLIFVPIVYILWMGIAMINSSYKVGSSNLSVILPIAITIGVSMYLWYTISNIISANNLATPNINDDMDVRIYYYLRALFGISCAMFVWHMKCYNQIKDDSNTQHINH